MRDEQTDQERLASELDQRVAERTRELAETNEELQLQVGLLQHLPVSAWTLKPDGTPDFVNQVWLEFSGQTLDFVRSHPEAWMTAVHPEDRERASKAFWEGVRSGRGFAFETRSLRARDGTWRWHLSQAVVLRDPEGKVLRFVGTTTDIDDQKRAQEELRASEGRLRRVIDTIPTLAWCNRADGPNEFLSKSWHQYTGLSPEEAHGWGWQAAFHPEDLPPLMKSWQQLLVSGESGEIEARLRRHDGEYRWFLIRVAPFRDDTGTILRWYGTSTDIHDRKLADQALRASEHNLRQILDGIPGFVFVAKVSPAGQVDLPNQRFLDYFGRTLEEVNAWSTNDLVHPDDLPRVIAEVTHSFTTGAPYNNELRYRRADGVYRWFQVRILPERDADGRITRWYGLLTDIDDRKRAEDALNELRSELAHVARVSSLGALTASIAHEVNQPLTAIVSGASACLRILSADSPNIDGVREAARGLIRDSKRASEVILRLRALFTKKEAPAENIDLNEAAREVIALCSGELQRNRVVLRQELANDLPPITGDRVQLQQVVLNLLRNASDAMNAVEDRPRELVIRTEKEDGDCVRLTVQDTGVGIPSQDMERLFEAFYTTKSDGMGIGLSVSRSIIERHSGRLWAIPNNGPGATFLFSLPCKFDEVANSRTKG
jgi:PAS domain S-box-containing protein